MPFLPILDLPAVVASKGRALPQGPSAARSPQGEHGLDGPRPRAARRASTAGRTLTPIAGATSGSAADCSTSPLTEQRRLGADEAAAEARQEVSLAEQPFGSVLVEDDTRVGL